jgi:hypothetical protein
MALADSYLETTRELYRQAAAEPQLGLCCTTSDKTVNALAALGRDDIYLSGSTWHYDGGGCC